MPRKGIWSPQTIYKNQSQKDLNMKDKIKNL